MTGKMGLWSFVGGVLLTAVWGLAGPAGTRAEAPAAKPLATATIFSYYDALRSIGGADVDSVILLPPRQSPHEYEPTVNDKATVAKSVLIIKNGLGIDRWVDKLRVSNKTAVLVDVGQLVKDKGIQPLKAEEVTVTPASEKKAGEGEDVSAGNPHIWLDPRVQAMAAEAIRDALVHIDPPHKDGYEARAKVYLDDLAKLDKDFTEASRQFKQKDFIGFHSAYAYLARRYALNQVAAVEELADQGPSLAQQTNIIRLIRQKNIKVIFMETAFPAKSAERIVRETGVKTGILQPLETYDDKDQTYVSLMRDNLKSLSDAMMN